MYIESERLIITDLTMSMSGDFQKNSLDEDNRCFGPDEVFDTIEKAEDCFIGMKKVWSSLVLSLGILVLWEFR